MSAVSLLQQAAALLREGKVQWQQRSFATGLYNKDRPREADKPWPKPHEVYPWAPRDASGAALYRLDAVSVAGALCYVAQTHVAEDSVQQALKALHTTLQAQGVQWPVETWQDIPGRTLDEVLALIDTTLAALEQGTNQ